MHIGSTDSSPEMGWPLSVLGCWHQSDSCPYPLWVGAIYYWRRSLCRLTDWQKVDAVNTFIISRASYHLRAARPSIGWATNLDTVIRSSVKKGLSLPRRTISSIFYVSRKHGGLGLYFILDNLHFARISQAMSCLDSLDSRITIFAYDQLYQLLQHHAGVSSPSPEEVQRFLNSAIDPLGRQRHPMLRVSGLMFVVHFNY